MSEELRTTLHRLADSTTPLPVDDGLWQRGQAARRRGQALAIAAVLVLLASVGGIATLVTTTDQEARTASSEVVEGGALPSTIVDTTDVPFEEELPVGRASVAFLASGGITLIGAETGQYHQFGPADPPIASSAEPLLALSPDGWKLAWTSTDRIAIGDLESGEVVSFVHNMGRGADVEELTWLSDSTTLSWSGTEGDEPVGGQIDVAGPSEGPFFPGDYGTHGIPSPSFDMVALPSAGVVTAAPFVEGPESGDVGAGAPVDRPLPTDLYPKGAVVEPVGWAADNLVVAVVDPPPGDDVERPRLAIFSSPDRPDHLSVYREFLPGLPPVESLSFAVDLIPDLTDDPGQELTHDFAAESSASSDNPLAFVPVEIALLLAIGVAFAIAVLLGLRWLWRRFT